MQIQIPEPWISFLREVDQALSQPVEVHCLGGFALTVLYGLSRPTADVDFIEIRPREADDELIRIAGGDSEIGRRYKLHFHWAGGIAELPEAYESRLIDITPKGFQKLRLMAFEAHDIVLSKIARNSPKDRSDVEFLATKGLLNRYLLNKRFESELRPHLQVQERGMLTMQLWLEEFLDETRGRGKR
jgi:uncharacterized nucleotidyltransferase DUF6036